MQSERATRPTLLKCQILPMPTRQCQGNWQSFRVCFFVVSPIQGIVNKLIFNNNTCTVYDAFKLTSQRSVFNFELQCGSIMKSLLEKSSGSNDWSPFLFYFFWYPLGCLNNSSYHTCLFSDLILSQTGFCCIFFKKNVEKVIGPHWKRLLP